MIRLVSHEIKIGGWQLPSHAGRGGRDPLSRQDAWNGPAQADEEGTGPTKEVSHGALSCPSGTLVNETS
jgi:hypothetical protein